MAVAMCAGRLASSARVVASVKTSQGAAPTCPDKCQTRGYEVSGTPVGLTPSQRCTGAVQPDWWARKSSARSATDSAAQQSAEVTEEPPAQEPPASSAAAPTEPAAPMAAQPKNRSVAEVVVEGSWVRECPLCRTLCRLKNYDYIVVIPPTSILAAQCYVQRVSVARDAAAEPM